MAKKTFRMRCKPIKPKRKNDYILSQEVYDGMSITELLGRLKSNGYDLDKSVICIDDGYGYNEHIIIINYICEEPEDIYNKRVKEYEKELRDYNKWVSENKKEIENFKKKEKEIIINDYNIQAKKLKKELEKISKEVEKINGS